MSRKILEKDIVLGLIHEPDFVPKLIDSGTTGSDFDKPSLAWIVDNSIDYFKEYNRTPTKNVLRRLLERDKQLKEEEARKFLHAIKTLFNKKPDNPNFSLNELQKFSTKKKLITHLEKSAEKISDNEDIDEVIRDMTANLLSLEQQKYQEWECVDWLDGFEERMKLRKYRKKHPELYKSFRFGIKALDQKIRRGVRIGDMASIGAKTGKGKSVFTIGSGLQGLFQRFNVTHITTENELDQTTGRYDTRATGIPYDQIQLYDFEGEQKSLLKQANQTINMLRDNISTKLKIVKCIPNKTSIITVMDILDRLEKREGHKTELLIVDSPELMESVTKFKEHRLQKAAVYWELKSLLLERKLIGLVTSQLTRGSDDGMPTPEDMSEAYEKARLLDLMMVLVRTTKHMLTDEAMLWIVKARDFANDGQPIHLHTDFSCMFMDVK